jgi:hypothetical protein
MTTINAMPLPAPSRSMDAPTFINAMDATLAALPPLVTQINLVAGELNANAVIASNAATLVNGKADESAASAAAANSAAAAAQAVAVSVDAQSTNATSVTSLSIAVGSKSLVTQSTKSFFVGMNVKIASAADTSNYMFGVVTSFAGGVLAVNVFDVFGAGTFSDWSITRYVEEARSTASNIMLYQHFL